MKEILEHHNKWKAKVTEMQEKFTAIVEEDDRTFKNVIADIPKDFGSFLHSSLGERITGQRSSVFNDVAFEEGNGLDFIARQAKTNNQSLDDYLKRMSNGHNKIYSHITVGRKFGFSYYTGGGKRLQTTYLNEKGCFFYLTQEHVNCIKDKEKRACVQDFYDFKMEYLKALNELNIALNVDMPVKIGKIYDVCKSEKVGSYNRKSENYYILDGVKDDVISHIAFYSPQSQSWDKSERLRHDLQHFMMHTPSGITMTFVRKGKDKLNIMGNMGFTSNGVQSCIDTYATSSCDNCTNLEPRGSQLHNMYDVFSEYSRYHSSEPNDGVIMNLDEIISNPIVKKEVDKRISFYVKMSDKLTDLKHKHASLYFLHGDM